MAGPSYADAADEDGGETEGGRTYDGDGGDDVAGNESTGIEAAQQAAASVQFSLISSREFVSSFLRAFLDRFSQFFSISDTGKIFVFLFFFLSKFFFFFL